MQGDVKSVILANQQSKTQRYSVSTKQREEETSHVEEATTREWLAFLLKK